MDYHASSKPIGKVKKFVASRRVVQAPGGTQTFSFGNDNAENVSFKANKVSSTRVHKVPGGKSSIFSTSPEPVKRSSTRRKAPPGGNSNVGSLISRTQQAPVSQPSRNTRRPSVTRSSVFSQEPVQPQRSAVRRNSRSTQSNVFSSEPVQTPRSSTRVHANPGGQSGMSSILGHQNKPHIGKTIRTAKSNAGHKNLFAMSPEKSDHKSRRTARSNQSHNVMNLTPGAQQRRSARTGKMNQQSQPAQPVLVNKAKFAKRNKDIMGSNIFAAAKQPRSKTTSVRVRAAPGGNSNIRW